MVPRQRITILCGDRDSGKTARAQAMASRFTAEGLRIGGVLSIAELRDGQKAGYRLLDCASGAGMTYARRRRGPPPPGGLAFEFIDEGFAFGAAAIRKAAAENVDALFVDEVGPLEMEGGGLWEPLRETRSSYGGLLVVTVRPDLLEELLRRLFIDPDGAEIVRLPGGVAGAPPS